MVLDGADCNVEIVGGILDVTGLNGPSFPYTFAAVLAGAYLKGYTGFGASMLWMTSLSLVLPLIQVVSDSVRPIHVPSPGRASAATRFTSAQTTAKIEVLHALF